jgi:hypothetical protein
MQSSKENSRKHKNDLDKRGKYQKFEGTCIQIREPVIKSYAAALNGGSCRRGFVKDLVDGAAQAVP